MEYRDIVSDYREYIRLQKEEFFGFERNEPRWKRGQERYIEMNFEVIDRDSRILDIACGDGIGLDKLKELGFFDVVGVEISERKAEKARESDFPVYCMDMHNLDRFMNREFDIVYSSHTLEHAYWPGMITRQFHRILKSKGKLLVILPYPDKGPDSAHGGKYELGTSIEDDGEKVTNFFLDRGFELISKRFDDFREPEIWLDFEKV